MKKKIIISIVVILLGLAYIYIAWAFPPTPPSRSPKTLTKSFSIYGASPGDDFLLWRTPQAIRIIHIHGVLLTGTNVVGGLDECDENGANAVAVDSDITFNGGLDSDDGSLTNPDIDPGDWIKWHTTSVSSPGYLTVTVYYQIKWPAEKLI